MTAQGMFIVFEGIDGSGKSTQIELLRQWLPTSGLMPKWADLVVTCEPGGTPLGRVLQGHLIAPEMEDTIEEYLLHLAARAHHVRTVIDPAIEVGNWVLCDRYVGSTVAYQGQNISKWKLDALSRWTASKYQPDITFLLSINTETAIERIKKRDGNFLETQERLRNAARSYQSQSIFDNKMRWEVIDASKKVSKVLEQCKTIIKNKANEKS